NLPADLKAVVMAAIRNGPRSTRLYYRRGSAIAPERSFLNRRFFSCLNAVIANSGETAALIRQSGLLPAERVAVIYNGLDAEAFDAALEQAQVRPLHERNEPFSERNPLVIGSAGRLSRQKAQHYLLHLSAELKRRHFPHRLILAGDGELRGELLELARKLELDFVWQGQGQGQEQGGSGRVIFTGFLEDMSAFWRGIDLFVLTSIWEGFGYVLAEAMLASKPLLAFDCSNMPELVRDGENGLLLPPPWPLSGPDFAGAPESDGEVGARLADKVEELALDPARLCFMGEAGRAFCLRYFDQGAAMRKLERLLFF
ncbi:MAG: glycosyltransferase family 4 protein, partial [Deltaproteobacteria bacterium]|nr:glycosyltransferase family 4 protein [Deltaproteobacteria bacterium]